MDCIELSIKSLDEECKEFARKIQHEYQPDLVVYVARGSYLIAKSLVKVLEVPLVAVGAQRRGNNFKEIISPILSVLPRSLCNMLRKLELKSDVHGEKPERYIEFLDDISSLDLSNIKKLLIVDDSVDTGRSMLAVRELVKLKFPNCEIKTASLNVMSKSKGVIKIDYTVYEDKILRTPMSKDSKEYKIFIKLYNNR